MVSLRPRSKVYINTPIWIVIHAKGFCVNIWIAIIKRDRGFWKICMLAVVDRDGGGHPGRCTALWTASAPSCPPIPPRRATVIPEVIRPGGRWGASGKAEAAMLRHGGGVGCQLVRRDRPRHQARPWRTKTGACRPQVTVCLWSHLVSLGLSTDCCIRKIFFR
jgi:hypothetical protein